MVLLLLGAVCFLQILAGHEGPVTCVAFSMVHSILASGSWDHSVRLWDVFQSKGARTIHPLSCDGNDFLLICLICMCYNRYI